MEVDQQGNRRRRLLRWNLALLAVAGVWAVLLLVPVLSHRGWPGNHDDVAPVSRMAALLGQWQAGNWIAVWSSNQQGGFGSPMPILYHKLHMYLSTAVLAVTSSIKAALVLPIWLLMVTGFCGMVFCLRQFLVPRHRALQWLGAAMLPATHYATTDWLVRGAMAEFAAMMILPWIFAWCARLLLRGVWEAWIGLALGALALAHTTLGLFCLLPLGIASSLAAWRWRSRLVGWARPAAISVLVGALCVAPFVLPMVAMARFNRVERLNIAPMFVPRTNLLPTREFFWSSNWHWGDAMGMSWQIDLSLWLLLPVFMLSLWMGRNAVAVGVARGLPQVERRWLAVFLIGTVAVMAWLQTPLALWVFDWVPGTRYLQFTWRLLAFLTVALLICAFMALAAISDLLTTRFGLKGWVAGLCLGLVVVFSTAEAKMWWHKPRYPWHAREHLAATLAADEYWAFGEFLPKVDWTTGNDLWAAQRQATEWMGGLPRQACTVRPANQDLQAPKKEHAGGTWEVRCAAAAEVALPVFLAPGMEVRVRADDDRATRWTLATPRRTCSDPRLRLRLPAGGATVQVLFPNWLRSSAAVLAPQAFDYRRDCATPAP